MRPETVIENRVCDLAWTYLGVENTKLVTPSENGWPDRIFWLPGGKPLLIEFKAPGEEPRPKQVEVHERLRNLGYEIQVHDTIHDGFKAIIDGVESACVSKESRAILTQARRACAVLKSRFNS